jgi:flavin-dependent dehydrogenase
MTTSPVEIVGAGPSGLAAALTVARGGGRALVSERHTDVGLRFHEDFQGLEDWTTEGDVLEELASLGIEPTFEHTPFRESVFYDPEGREHVYRSQKPLWYLVRRGPLPGTLDDSLKAQAVAAGVEIRFGVARMHLPEGGIVAHGPHRADAIAVGYVFDTDRADGAFGAVSDTLAPKGYSYLLICGGRGTVATCLFADFHNEKAYLDRTVEFFREKVGLEMREPRPFGGYGNVFSVAEPRKGRLLYVGEGAGFQDALFGFGMRFALLSGHLAVRACMEGKPETYDGLWQRRFGGLLKQSVVNRYFYEKLGDRGYISFLEGIDRASDGRDWLRGYYAPGRLKLLLHPLARRRVARKPELIVGCIEGCDRTWCRCEGHGGAVRAKAEIAAAN